MKSGIHIVSSDMQNTVGGHSYVLMREQQLSSLQIIMFIRQKELDAL